MDRRTLEEQGWPCPTAEEMRAIDSDAILRRNVPGRVLMENAGRAVARALIRRWPGVRRPLVVCGAGNNGGDGFVLARVLHEWDAAIRPRVLRLFDASPPDDAKACLDLLEERDLQVDRSRDPATVAEAVSGADLIVDAIFGVGLSRGVEGDLAGVFEVISSSRVPLLSVDLPSGLSSDSGRATGALLAADLTVTLGLPKLGLALQPLAGELWVVDIGLPPASIRSVAVRQHLLTRAAAARRLPARPPTAHKGSFGHLLAIAGSEGKTGAAALVATGALRAGAGLVTVAAPATLHDVLEIKLTEAMTLPAASDGPGFAASAAPRLLEAARLRDAVVLGPGLGNTGGAFEVARRVVAEWSGPLVVDADGLAPFAGACEGLAGPGARVLTPHPGELGRLLDRPTAQVEEDRVGSVREVARRSGCVTLLKGARSLIAHPSGELRINPTGGPALASGGSGDVLAGVIGTFLMQGLDPFDAASLGAFVHGLAGEASGRVGATASEVAARIPDALRALQHAHEPPGEARLFP